MKHISFALVVFFFLLQCANSKISSNAANHNNAYNTKKYANTITEMELKEMLYKFASDEFEGRDTGKKGQKLAVNYLKSQYESMGVSSVYGNDNYFQKVYLEQNKIYESSLAINGKTHNNLEDYVVVELPMDINRNTNQIVYAGYGIDEDNYSDYKNISVKNKIVLVKSGEPKDDEGNFIITGNKKPSKWSMDNQSVSSKRKAAKNNGAIALWLVDDKLFMKYATWYKRNAESDNNGRLYLKGKQNFSVLILNETLGQSIYPKILTNYTPATLNASIKFSAVNKSEQIDSENVVALIKGCEFPEEVIVISAHLDHLGFNNEGIYNGADDDGSGTIAMLEIAEAFKIAKNEGYCPKRSILFLHVTGEEKGLLGSGYYTDIDPLFALKNTVANLNIDMIGRTDPKRKTGKKNYVYLIGSDKLSTELHEISETVNTRCCNLDLDYMYNHKNDPNRFYYRSDHYNFAKNNIPVIFYFNGTHKDYHKPTDTADKIEYDLLKNRTRLIFYTAWELANRTNRIIVDKSFE